MIEDFKYTKTFKMIYKLFPCWVQWLHGAPDQRRQKSCEYPLGEVILSGICLFLFRYPSIRSFVKEFRGNEVALANLNEFFTLKDVPSDDELRYALSHVPTSFFNRTLRSLHQRLERKKQVQAFRLLDKYDLIALDGSGQISSYKIHCEKCLTRNKTNKPPLYLHGQLVASLISAKHPVSLSMSYEPIENIGVVGEYEKNDCEINAAKRLLKRMKSHYPKRPFCITGDNLFSAQTITEQIKNSGWSFIIVAKPERNKEIFSWYDYLHEKKQSYQWMDEQGHQHHYEWSNRLPLKQVKDEDKFWVNLLEYTEVDSEGKVLYYNTWITDIELKRNNIKEVAKGGRARFIIENVSFNELKTRGYHIQHNYGHFGDLPNVFFGLALLAHLFSQLFYLWREGKRLVQQVGSNRRFWERMATLYSSIRIPVSDTPIFHIKFDFNSS